MNRRIALAKTLHHPFISDPIRLRFLAGIFHWVDDAINERSSLQAQVELWAEEGQVLVIRDSTDCDGAHARYKHLMPANWRQVQDYINQERDRAEGPQQFRIRSPRRMEVY